MKSRTSFWFRLRNLPGVVWAYLCGSTVVAHARFSSDEGVTLTSFRHAGARILSCEFSGIPARFGQGNIIYDNTFSDPVAVTSRPAVSAVYRTLEAFDWLMRYLVFPGSVALMLAYSLAVAWDRYHQPGGWGWDQLVAPEIVRFNKQGVCR